MQHWGIAREANRQETAAFNSVKGENKGSEAGTQLY